MTPKLRIALFSPDKNIADVMELRLRSKGHQVVTLTHLTDLLGFIYSDPPDLLIVDLTAPDPEIQTVIRGLKEEGHFSVIPIIGLIQESMEELFDWAAYPWMTFSWFRCDIPSSSTALISRFSGFNGSSIIIPDQASRQHLHSESN